MDIPCDPVDDLSRSLAVFDQSTSLIVVVELSEASWPIAGLIPGVDRQPLKKLAPDADALAHLLERWRAEAVKAGTRPDASPLPMRRAVTGLAGALAVGL